MRRPLAFAVVAGAYLVAGLAALLVVLLTRGHHPVTIAFLADLAATLVVFLVSTAVGNASLYDPYWSVAPPIVVSAWALFSATGASGVRQVLVVGLLWLWGIRLTTNWAVSWRGLGHEDWRYVDIRAKTRGRLPWWLVNLTGIQLMPTLVVFLGLLAAWPAVAVGRHPLGLLDLVATVVTAAAITVEAVADRQVRRFAADPANRGRIADRGLWRWSRHPNYLGEIGVWWGVWLFGLAAAPHWWWTVIGPITMVALFAFVSVPLMDKRSLARRPAYAEHMRRVPALLPLPLRSRDVERDDRRDGATDERHEQDDEHSDER
jgi:steroid 5-alpha reductase family enzyme